jgi:hypothetical protein
MSNENQHYFIEVLGESSFQEKAVSFPFEIEITASQKIEEDGNLENRLLNLEKQVDAVISQSKPELLEIADGGRRLTLYEHGRIKKRVVSHKYLLSAKSSEIIDVLLRDVVNISTDEGESIVLTSKKPIFLANDEDVKIARKQAYKTAYDHAEVIAKEADTTLKGIISVKQLASGVRSSGAYADSDWSGDSDRFQSFHVGSSGDGTLNLSEPTRTIFVRYLIKFELER